MDFYIKDKIITLDKNTLPPDGVVGDNTGYTANFFFDDGWTGGEKTARFIGNDGKHKDVILNGDSCEFPPEVMKSGLVRVGVFAGNLETTTPAIVPIRASILDKDGLPADPTPDVYTQLTEMIKEIRDKAVSDEEIAEAVRKYMEDNPPVTITTITASDVEGS